MTMVQYADITVHAPSSNETLASAADYASAAFQDPWDMNEQTDLGWFTFDTTSGSKSNLTNIVFANGRFSASAVTADPYISVVDTALYQGDIANLGKVGSNYKIDASKHRVFAIRMKMSEGHGAQLFWSKNTIYQDQSMSNPDNFPTYAGWGIYIVDIPSLGWYKVRGNAVGWTGYLDSLRFDPANKKVNIEIDWIRLVESDDSLRRTVQWSGQSGLVDIVLDNDRDESNGTLGVAARNVSGSSYSLYVGALQPNETYYVGVRNAGGGQLSYSPGSYTVNDIPCLTFTSPSEEGGEDFAASVLGNAWDMNALSDIDKYSYLAAPPGLTTIAAQNKAGKSLGNISVLTGTNINFFGAPGDPIIYPLWFDGGRGAANSIDSAKYRILVLKMAIPGPWDLNLGSVARVMWHVQGEFNGNVEKMNQSAAMVVQHKGGTVVLDTIITDLKTLNLWASQSNTGWNGSIDGFRVDPHEFSAPKTFYIKSVKIAAFEKADSSYVIEWDHRDQLASSPTLALYRDSNKTGFDGQLIASGLNPATGKYTWNTSGLAAGTYYIYGVFSDGRNSNRTYAMWPIVVSHSGSATGKISLSRKSLIFGGSGSISTPAQSFIVRNTGSGTMAWTVSSNASWLTTSPKSGTNSGLVRVSVNPANLARGTYAGLLSVKSANAVNSPQTVAVTLNVYRSSSTGKPFGDFATPLNGAIVSSSIPVTGWALDDIGVQTVAIYSGSTRIGDAIFVEGARPDIVTAFPNYPMNYRAGWGYMMLTNFLPNGGNGTYVITAKAIDREGRETVLGARTIKVDNVHAVKPFGALETPSPGGVASGKSFVNWAWALTPPPNKIAINGSTITVYVNGAALGHPVYNLYRADIAQLFPNHLNRMGAFGKYVLDTTKYADGLHNIQWVVRDNAGNQDGVGSRYFNIQNFNNRESAESLSAGDEPGVKTSPFHGVPLYEMSLPATLDDKTPVSVLTGFSDSDDFRPFFPGADGATLVEIHELERIVLKLAPGTSGCLLAAGLPCPLPAGSTLDREHGVFYWSPGVGFNGDYELAFSDARQVSYQKIRVRIKPLEFSPPLKKK